MITATFRSDYDGEFVIIETRWAGGKKEQIREWVANPIINQHISGRAACIASNINQDRFDHTRLQRHKGGLLSSKKLQTYGVGNLTKDMRLDFAVETDKNKLEEILKTGYQENNIVYTTSRQCVDHPGEFYLVPYSPGLCSEALVCYLAAFDGHKEIFMLGYNTETPASTNTWIDQVAKVIKAYKGVSFTAIGIESQMPTQWMSLSNFQLMDYRSFVSYCDV